MAISSMTGFGGAQGEVGDALYSVEIKTVNQRFLEVSIRLPPGVELLEPLIQKEVRSKLTRGKCDVLVIRRGMSAANRFASFDPALFQSAAELLYDGLKDFIPDEIERRKLIASELISRGDIFRVQDAEVERGSDVDGVLALTRSAIEQVLEMRRSEGVSLQGVLLNFVRKIEEFVAQVEPLAGEFVERFRERVSNRLKSVELPLDSERVAMEVAMLADRTDVTEELDRMRSHLAQFRGLLVQGGEVGKRLEFLVQELGREVNTIGSKSQDGKISARVVEAKAILEKIREQVQNIE